MIKFIHEIKERIVSKDSIINGVIIGVVITLIGSYLWSRYVDYSQYHTALNENLYFRNEFKSDDLRTEEIQTNLMTGSEFKTRIMLIQNFNYFDNVFYFSLNRDSKNFPDTYSGIVFYDLNPVTKNYEPVYKFIPLDIAQENFLPGAREQGIKQIPLLLTKAELGDIDNDGKSELITEWSYCNFNHCVWSYPVILGFNGGYYVKWTMPKHELTEHDLKDDYWWGGQIYQREIVNLYDNRKYKINGGNYINYKYIDNGKNPFIISYNIDDESCWACDHTYLLDIFTPDSAIQAKYTFHQAKDLETQFKKVEDFKFSEIRDFNE